MRTKYPVLIECSKKQKRKHKRRLRRFRMYYAYRNNGCYYFLGRIDERHFNDLKEYCQYNHLKYRIDNEYGERSTTYRKAFFETYHPIFGNYYFCSYCGKLCSRETITVDHLYPISTVSHDIKLQKKLKRKGITNINDVKNLVPACEACNKQKGRQTGSWIRKGEIGRHQILWIFRHLLRISALIILVIMIFMIYHHIKLISI